MSFEPGSKRRAGVLADLLVNELIHLGEQYTLKVTQDITARVRKEMERRFGPASGPGYDTVDRGEEVKPFTRKTPLWRPAKARGVNPSLEELGSSLKDLDESTDEI